MGVVFGCDYGHGYGFDKGHGGIEMKPGDKAHFSHHGTVVDDAGDSEAFSVDYHLELYDWDDTLFAQ